MSTIIFCLSYLNIEKTEFIVKTMGAKMCLVLTNIDSIYEYFKQYRPDINIIYYEPVPFIHKKEWNWFIKLFKYIPIILFRKEKWKSYYDMSNIKEVYLFNFAYCEFECWFIKYLYQRHGIIVHYDRETSLENLTKFRLNYYVEFIIQIVYGIRLESLTYETNNNKILNIPTPFFLRTISADCSVIQHKKIIKADILYPVVLLIGTIVKENYVTKKEYIYKTDKLIQYLIEKFGKDSIFIKCHPRYNIKYSLEKSLNEIDSKIPGEIIIKKSNVIIGYNSTLISKSASFHKTTISLINYYNSAKQLKIDFKKNIESKLYSNKFKVFYPHDISELDEIIKQ